MTTLHTCLSATPAPPSPLDSSLPLESLKRSNAELDRFVLDNGMVCLVKEDHSAPVTAVQIWIGTGSINEGRLLGAGLSHFIEHMIFKGTPTRSPGDIFRQISDAGGEINAYTAQDRTVFHTTLPSKNWKTGLDVLADAVMNAAFPQEEWEREREVILREFAMTRDDPRRELNRLFWSTAYLVHPYRIPVIGYEEIFKTITHDDLVRFFRENYVPDNMIAVIVGDIKGSEVREQLSSVFNGFLRRARDASVLPRESIQLAPRFTRKTGPYKVSRLEWGYHATAMSDPETPTLDVLATIVGAGRSSRLVREIKEKKKLVYEISAQSYTPKDPGYFGISATFNPSNEEAVITAIQAEIDSWATDSFSQDEIEKAKRMVLVNELSSLQTMEGQAYSFASGEFYAADPGFSERYLEKIMRVDAEMLRESVRKHLTIDNRTVAILAPETPAETNRTASRVEAAAKPEKMTLTNGISVIVREDHRLPFVYFCATFRGGLLNETADNNGITQLMSDLLVRGTDSRSSQEIAEKVESLGGYLAPFCGRNSFGLQARCLSSDADVFMDLIGDCLAHSIFPEAEMEKQRSIQLSGIRQQREQPFFIAEESLRRMLFPNHPYQWTALGTEQTVSRIDRDQILAIYKKEAVKKNMVFSIFGDVSLQQAQTLAEQFLSNLPDGEPAVFDNIPAQPKLPARIKSREPKQQTIFLAGYPGVDLKDPRMDALAVIENALSGLSSDLGVEVRDKRGLVYFVGAFNRPGLEPGLFALYAGTREDKVEEVERLIAEQIARIANKGLRGEEVQRAKEQIIAAYEMSLQNNGDLAQTCALNELYGLGYDYAMTIKKRMDSLTDEDILHAAASVFQDKLRAVSLVLPEPIPSEQNSNHVEEQ